MRHRVVEKKLGRDQDHRKALERSLTQALIKNENIETTLAKAKWVKPFVEKQITRAKKVAQSKDKIFKFNNVKTLKKDLVSEETVRKLVEDVAPRFAERSGGYTKIIRTRYRSGDNALMARLELVTTKVEVEKESKNEKE